MMFTTVRLYHKILIQTMDVCKPRKNISVFLSSYSTVCPDKLYSVPFFAILGMKRAYKAERRKIIRDRQTPLLNYPHVRT